jgi:hypothetical protein
MRHLPLALALTVATACGGGSGPGRATAAPAVRGVQTFIQVLRSDDPKPAYDLLTADVRATVTFDDFAARWQSTAPERELQARALEESLKGNPSLGERTRVQYADGKTVVLVREADHWKLDSALVSRTHATEPHDALTIFAESLEARDYRGVMGILSERRREGIGKQVDAFITSLNQNLTPSTMIDQIGPDRAEARWQDDGIEYKIVLRKEGDEWRVDDIDLRPVTADDSAEDPDADAEADPAPDTGPDQP